MADLFAPVCSITTTKRRRFLWACWWTRPPCQEPFGRPDAYEGGAKSREEALRNAEKAAQTKLIVIEDRWAQAWTRVLRDLPPWPKQEKERAIGARGEEPEEGRRSLWDILGVAQSAGILEIKQAFRKRALETHPDQGGRAEEFQALCEAYKKALSRRSKAGKRARKAWRA